MKNTLEMKTKPQRCIELNSKNTRCSAYAQKGGQYCWRHSPDISDDEKKRQSARGGKAKRLPRLPAAGRNASVGGEGIKLPPIKFAGIDDIVTLLGDTINRIRDGSISPKFASSTAYVAMTLIMAMKQSEAAKERKRIEELKANGLWPEPVFPPKTYVYKDKFYMDRDGKKYFEDCTPAFSHLRPEDEEPAEEFDDGFEDDNENEEPLPAPKLRQAGETQEPEAKEPEAKEPQTKEQERIFNNPSIDIVFANNNLSPVGGDSS